MRYTEKEVFDWIDRNQCVEFVESNSFMEKKLEAVYHIMLNEDGDFVSNRDNAATVLTYSVDISEWADDDSPERFYEEFETLDNPEFKELVARITREVNEV